MPALRGLDSESVDLIYLDPPFNTGKQWHAPIGSDAEGASFNDIWAWDDVADAEDETLATSVKRQWLNALHIESPIRAVVDTAESTAGEEMSAYLAFMALSGWDARQSVGSVQNDRSCSAPVGRAAALAD